MQLRKDPITRSWVITGDDPAAVSKDEQGCRYCADSSFATGSGLTTCGGYRGRNMVGACRGASAQPIFHVEGDPQRSGEGLYDKMQSVGAHEILNRESEARPQQLWKPAMRTIEQFLLLVARPITDSVSGTGASRLLKPVSKNFGSGAGQDFTIRFRTDRDDVSFSWRILYDLRAGKYFQQKERCVFCDILARSNGKRCASWNARRLCQHVSVCTPSALRNLDHDPRYA